MKVIDLSGLLVFFRYVRAYGTRVTLLYPNFDFYCVGGKVEIERLMYWNTEKKILKGPNCACNIMESIKKYLN